jgi:TolB-like protein/Flp pilus assembly protein TadD
MPNVSDYFGNSLFCGILEYNIKARGPWVSLFTELQRRNVFRVAIAYLAGAWLLSEVATTLFPLFGFSDTPARIVVILSAIGFPLFLVFSWIFEITPEGLKLEKDVQREASLTRQTDKKLDRVIVVLLILALGYFAVDKFILEPERVADIIEEATQQVRTEAFLESYGDQSIAVLPFVNISADPKQEYFSDGITEEILNLLAREPNLRVISRTSAFSFKGRNVKIADIAKELGVRYILEGSVRRSEDRVRVTTQLIEATTDRHVWSESYERTLGDIFAIEDEIAASVLPAIEHQLTGRPLTVRRTDPAAYSLYLQGLHFFLQRTASGLDLAVEYALRVIEIDPEYAPAWTLLGSAYINQVNVGKRPWAESYRLATEAIDRSLALAPDFAFAHSARAWVAMAQERDYIAAAAHFRRARALAPNNAIVLGNNSVLAVRLGRLDEALQLTERSIELDPTNSVGYANRSDQLIRLGRPAEAERAARKALALSPGMNAAQSNLALALLLQEQPTAALKAVQTLESETVRQAILALAYYSAGDWGAADRSLALLEQRHAQNSAYLVALVHAWRGEVEDAFRWLDKAIEEKQSVFGIRTEPFLRVLHDDPRWEITLEKVGLGNRQVGDIVL